MKREDLAGRKVVIRTLDIGADKQVDYFNMEHEENPAMGYRAIRICLDRIDVFKTQLRALYRASAFGTISIMFPMIISVEEVRQIKKICEEVKGELDAHHVEYGDVELGICGELGADTTLTEKFIKMGIDELSVSPNMVLPIRNIIVNINAAN